MIGTGTADEITPTTATTTLTSINTPGTAAPGALYEGLVVGLVEDLGRADVEFSCTITGANTIQLWVLDENVVVFQDWIDVATVADDACLSSPINLSQASGWWQVENCAKRNAAAAVRRTERWGVGYKVLLLGQSQMVIMLRQDDSDHNIQTRTPRPSKTPRTRLRSLV